VQRTGSKPAIGANRRGSGAKLSGIHYLKIMLCCNKSFLQCRDTCRMTRRTIKSISLKTLDYLELLMFCEKIVKSAALQHKGFLGTKHSSAGPSS
jgi:hypothetical protein